MRTFLFVMALIGVAAGVAIPAATAKDPAKPTGERCIERAQTANLSQAGLAAATAACTKHAATVRDTTAAQ